MASILCWCYCNTDAQQLSETDLQIVNDIKQGIADINVKTDGGFKDLLIYGVVAKDTDVILYNAVPTELLHAAKYSVLNYFLKKQNIYVCAYENKHDVMLAEKALEEMSYKLGSDWKLMAVKSDQINYTKNYLYYKEKWLAYYEKPNDGTSMNISFMAQYSDDGDSAATTNTNNTTNSFAENLSKN